MLYHTNIFEQSQIQYIRYEPYLEDKFLVYSVRMVENPQTCDEDFPESSSEIPEPVSINCKYV